MIKRILLFEAGKLLLLCAWLASLALIVQSAVFLVWYAIEYAIQPLPADFLLQIAASIPESLAFVADTIRFFFVGMALEEAKAGLLRNGLLLAGGIAGLALVRWLLKLVENGFKRRFMPGVLEDRFSELSYSPRKMRSVDEPLCDIGLLNGIERYYSANRLEGLYRDCWVAAEEIVCGGVYLNNYTSHRVKVRGQWLTIRLDRDFDGCVILETAGTRNRLTHRKIARSMVEIEFDYPAFSETFHCYSDNEALAHTLLNREMADKLLRIQEDYPDLCVIFREGCVHFLIRRRSFDRRWEYLVPFCLPYLRAVAFRLYGPLMRITDELLE